MGIWYELKNGKSVQICYEVKEYEPDVLIIKLFGGSTSFKYQIDKALKLNEILAEIEENYEKYEAEDFDFAYSSWCD